MKPRRLPPEYTRKLSKEEINALPTRKWEGPIELVRDDHALVAAMARLSGEPVLGFDTETRPAFRKGQSHDPALVQLAGRDEVVLVQLREVIDISPLVALLENHRVVKTGVGLSQDVTQLQRCFSFRDGGFLDLGEVARQAGVHQLGLRNMAALFFGFRISKRAQCSNWGAKELQPFQIHYAATDAWVSLILHQKLQELGVIPPFSALPN